MKRLTEILTARRSSSSTVLVGMFAGVAGVVSSFAVAGFTPSFIAGPIAGYLARNLPAPLIRFAIVVLGDLGDQLNVLMALLLSVTLLTGTSLLGVVAARRFGRPLAGAPAAAVMGALAAFGVTRALLASIVAGLGAGVVLATADILAGTNTGLQISAERRRVLGGVASLLPLVTGGYLVGARQDRTKTTDVPSVISESVATESQALLAKADERSLEVDELEPLVSEAFYEVDINATNPVVGTDEWTLTVTGAVETEQTYTYKDIQALDAENRFVTLRCVGESLNGKKLDNALWTGVPIMDLVEPAAPADECCVMLRAADGFYEEFPLPALADGFLAYGMNGDPLPRSHGFPARALIPGHWGEINVKWLTEIEVLHEELKGYWEQRGWHGTGPVTTVAKLHVVNHLDDGRVEVAGHAYAGTRGIQAVEVTTDGGENWDEADLSTPLPGEDVWRQWVYRYDPPQAEHEVVVRAIDGTGTLQRREHSGPYPSGATGWVSKVIQP